MESNLLDRMLSTYLEAQTPVTVTLQNKIRVSGRISAFDSYVIIIEGQKREILYRHAVSSLSSSASHEPRRTADHAKVAAAAPAPRQPRSAPQRQRPAAASALSAGLSETSINTTMKEGLLRWMQENKSAK